MKNTINSSEYFYTLTHTRTHVYSFYSTAHTRKFRSRKKWKILFEIFDLTDEFELVVYSFSGIWYFCVWLLRLLRLSLRLDEVSVARWIYFLNEVWKTMIQLQYEGINRRATVRVCVRVCHCEHWIVWWELENMLRVYALVSVSWIRIFFYHYVWVFSPSFSILSLACYGGDILSGSDGSDSQYSIALLQCVR